MTEDRDQLLRATIQAFAAREVEQLLLLCQLAAEEYPEELRKCFAICLGSEALEKRNNDAVQMSARAIAKANDANDKANRMMERIMHSIDKLEARVGELLIRLDAVEKKKPIFTKGK